MSNVAAHPSSFVQFERVTAAPLQQPRYICVLSIEYLAMYG
jgi:hypothetical protein